MIPKVIHYCWVGDNPLPKSAMKCIKSWKKFCPDYEIIEWNESNYDFTKNQYMKDAYETKKWGFVPDYARLDIVHRYGGIYLDVDVEIVRSFDTLLNYSGFAGFEAPSRINFGLGFGAEAGNTVIKEVMENYDNISFTNSDGTYNLLPSPFINTKILENIGLKCDGSFQLIDNFAFLPVEYLCPKSFEEGIIRKTKKTYSIHHFDASWYSEEEQKRKKKRWKNVRKEKIKYMPNRIAIRLLGKEKYEKMKKNLKRFI